MSLACRRNGGFLPPPAWPKKSGHAGRAVHGAPCMLASITSQTRFVPEPAANRDYFGASLLRDSAAATDPWLPPTELCM